MTKCLPGAALAPTADLGPIFISPSRTASHLHSLGRQQESLRRATVTATSQAQSAADPSKSVANSRKNLVEELAWLPLTLTAEIPVPDFTVENLLGLRAGSIVKTLYQSTADVPIRVNGKLVAWARFEVNGDRLASRITELA